MIGIHVKDKDDAILVTWQLSKVEIPKYEILEVLNDDSFSGEDAAAYRLGFPYGTTERIIIITKKENYVLFTNDTNLKNKIERMI
ncbi:hypothetical protein [Halobacillus massiliensis]|uniref:SunI/YnzG family protein n=1 Tax=Halobacillus massiliensis TaxID=1926286 RepID=UPI0009E3B708|nr:hypothetical protein [Halobacillus massiliensis]